MKSASNIGRLVLGIILLSGSGKVLAAKPQADVFTLENGIRVVSLHIPDSNNVSIFSFVPMGLASDGPGQTQWSHLIEHLVIRTTVPFGSQKGNAETLPDHMRLDFYGTVDDWQEGLSHHARWLAGIPFTQQNLQAEIPRITAECDFVAKRLATHKFAMAAWAQGYRHGRKHAALKADINRATLSEIQRYRDRHLAVLDKVVVCIVGGIDVKTLRPIVSKKLGTIQSQAKVAQPVKLHPGDRKMTWDLNARHIVLSWPIPDVTSPQYAALMVVGRLLMVRFNLDTELKTLTGMTLAGADLTVLEGNFFYVAASLRPQASFDDVRKQLQKNVDELNSDKNTVTWAAMIGQQLSSEIGDVMDPRTIKAQAPANVNAAMAEAQAGLLWGMYEFRYGQHRAALAERLKAVTGRQIQEAAMQYLEKEKCSVYCIEPEAEIPKSDTTGQ